MLLNVALCFTLLIGLNLLHKYEVNAYSCDFFDIIKGPVWKLPSICTDFHGILESFLNLNFTFIFTFLTFNFIMIFFI